MKTFGKVLIAVVIIGVIVLAVWYLGSRSEDEIEKVETMKIEKLDLSEIVVSYGTINPDRKIYLNSQRGNIVEEINKKEGEEVVKDDVIVKFENGAELKSPIDGRVIENNAVLGQDLTALSGQASSAAAATQSSLVTVGDFDPLVVNAEVDESDIILVEKGQWVRIYPDAYPDLVLEGEVEEIGMTPIVKQGETATLYPVKIKITDTKGIYPRDGLTADVDIIISTKEDVLALPVEAVIKDDGDYYIYLLKDNLADKQTVELGFETEDYFEVLEGLRVDDEVIVTRTGKLNDGDEVIVEE